MAEMTPRFAIARETHSAGSEHSRNWQALALAAKGDGTEGKARAKPKVNRYRQAIRSMTGSAQSSAMSNP